MTRINMIEQRIRSIRGFAASIRGIGVIRGSSSFGSGYAGLGKTGRRN